MAHGQGTLQYADGDKYTGMICASRIFTGIYIYF
ncbi:hypothetical protein EON63_08550, partial [archaeon]